MKNKLVSLIDMVKLSHNPELSEAYIRYLCGLNNEKQYRHQEIKYKVVAVIYSSSRDKTFRIYLWI